MSGATYARAGAWSLVAHATQIVGSIALSIVVVRMLSVEALGELTLGRQLMALVAVVGGFALERAVVRFVPEFTESGAPGAARRFVLETLATRAVLGAAIAVALILGRGPIARAIGIVDAEIVVYAAVGSLAFSVAAHVRAAANAHFEAGRVALATILTVVVGLIGSVVALWRGGGVAALLTVAAVAAALGAAAMWSKALGAGGVTAPVDRRRVLRYTGPFALIVLMNQLVHSQTEVFFLGRLRGPEEAAYFQYGFVFAQRVVDFLPLALWEVSMAAFARENTRQQRPDDELVLRYLRITYVLLIPIAAMGVALSPVLIEWLYGAKMTASVGVSQAYFVIGTLAAFGAPMGMVLYAHERTGAVLGIYTLGTLVNLGLDWILIGAHGLTGAVLGLAAGKFVIVAAMTWLAARIMGTLRVPWGSMARASLACAPVLGLWAWPWGGAVSTRAIVSAVAGMIWLLVAYRWFAVLHRDDVVTLSAMGIPGGARILGVVAPKSGGAA